MPAAIVSLPARRLPLGLLLLAGLCLSAAPLSSALGQDTSPTTWIDAKGRKVEAEFVRLTDEAVVLKLKADGREVNVPLNSLSLESHFQAVKLANPAAFSKPVPKAEIKEVVKVDLPELNLSVDDMLKSPFSGDPSIEQFLDILKREHQAHNYFVDWHALPPKIQADIEEVIVKSVETIGPATIRQIQILLQDVNTVAQKKQEFVLAYPKLASQPQVVALLDQHWPLLAGFVGAVSQAELWEVENFQKGKVVPWMAKLNVALIPHALAALENFKGMLPPDVEDPASIDYKIISQSADMAEVELTRAGQAPEKVRFQKVGNIWLQPAKMNDLRKGLDEVKAQLAKGPGPEVAMLRATLTGVIAGVGGLARANTQENFNLALDNLLLTVQSLQQSFAPRGGSGPPGGAPNGQMNSGGPMNSGGMNSGGMNSGGPPERVSGSE